MFAKDQLGLGFNLKCSVNLHSLHYLV